MNVAICTPTAGSVKASYVSSLLGMMTYYYNNQVSGRENEERGTTYNLIIGSNIAAQREQLVEDALSDPFVSHILFIDDDMGFKDYALNMALSRQREVVLANYRRKAPPWAFTARKIDSVGNAHEVVTNAESTGLEEVTFGGFGFCLIEIDIFRQLMKPRFLNRWIPHQQLYSTEDYPFFQTILDEEIAKVYVDHELSKLVCHIGEYQYQYGTEVHVDAKNDWFRPTPGGIYNPPNTSAVKEAS